MYKTLEQLKSRKVKKNEIERATNERIERQLSLIDVTEILNRAKDDCFNNERKHTKKELLEIVKKRIDNYK